MNKLKNIFDFYIFSNIHVAIATFCLTKITLLEIGINKNTTAFFVFFATLISYNVIRFLRINDIKSWFNTWHKHYKKYLYLVVSIACVFLFYFLFQIRFKALLILFPFALFTLFYVFPNPKLSLRNKAGAKLLLIALSWAGVTVLFPLIQNFVVLRNIDYITFLQRFIFIFAITIPFDIRDLKYDSIDLHTIPQSIGIKNSKILAIIAIAVFLFLEFIKMELFNQSYFMQLLLISVVTVFLILKSSIFKNKYYTSFFIEGIPILWFFLIYF